MTPQQLQEILRTNPSIHTHTQLVKYLTTKSTIPVVKKS